MSNNVKAIRIGDKIMLFVNGKKQMISKGVSPETFERVCELMNNNETEKITNLFDNFEDKVKEYLKDFFYFTKDKEIKLKNVKENKVNFSKLIVRKASEFMSLDESPLYIHKMAKKLNYEHNEEIALFGNKIFSKINKVMITKYGNMVIETFSDLEEQKGEVYGSPVKIENKGQKNINTKLKYSIQICSNKDESENLKKYQVLINPFDIISFTEESINVVRYAVLKDEVKAKNGLVEVENEELFEIPYQIYLEKFEKD